MMESEVAAPRPAMTGAFVRDRATWLGYFSLGYMVFLEAGLGPAMPSLREQLGLSYTVAGLHFTAIAGGATLMGAVGDRVARRLGESLAFWSAMIAMTLGAAGITAVPSIWVTLPSALAIGLASMVLAIVVQANLSIRHGEHRGIALAEVNFAASSGAVAATLGVGVAEQTGVGWRAAYVIAIVVAVVVMVAWRNASLALRVAIARGRSAGGVPRLLWVLCIAGAFSAAAEWCVAYWGADFLGDTASLSKGAAAALMSIFFISMAAGRLAGSRLARHFPARAVLVASFAVALIGFVCLWAPPWLPLRLMGLMFVGLGLANIFPAVASLATGLVPDRQDVAMARVLVIGSFAILVAPQILGSLGDAIGIERAFAVAIPVLAAGLLTAAAVARAIAPSPGGS